MRRALFLLIAMFLIASASGAVALVVPERCALTESGPEQSTECLPTCPTCGCCSSPVVVSIEPTQQLHLVIEPHTAVPVAIVGRLAPQDILHVPKASRL